MMVSLFSCDSDSDSDSDNRGSFTRMDIENASTLFVASSKDVSKIYGIRKAPLKSDNQADDEIYEIRYLDEDGNEVEKNNPCHIFDAGDYIIVCFGSTSSFSECYFVKKADGLIYEIPYTHFPHLVGNKYHWSDLFFSSIDKIQLDKNKNVYYTTYQKSSPHKKTLFKASSITSTLQFEEISAVNDDVCGFNVDEQGSIFYMTDYSNDYKMRYRNTDGSFVTLSRENSNGNIILCVWIGVDGEMYGILEKMVDETRINTKSYLVKVENDGQIAELREISQDICHRGSTVGSPFSLKNVFYVQGKIINSGIYPYKDGGYLANISDESSYSEIPCAVAANTVFDDQLYYFDENTFSCTHIDISSGQTSLLYDLDESKLGNFDIDNIMNISESGVTFSGIQLSNGQYIIAKLGIDNSVTIQQNIAGQIISILPINLK